MTLPDERYRALVEGRKLIEALYKNELTLEEAQDRARWVMRHYPFMHELELIAKSAPQYLDTIAYGGMPIK